MPPLFMGANYVGIGSVQNQTWIYLAITCDIGNVLDKCTYVHTKTKHQDFGGAPPRPLKLSPYRGATVREHSHSMSFGDTHLKHSILI